VVEFRRERECQTGGGLSKRIGALSEDTIEYMRWNDPILTPFFGWAARWPGN
jgi:hypothetical protein